MGPAKNVSFFCKSSLLWMNRHSCNVIILSHHWQKRKHRIKFEEDDMIRLLSCVVSGQRLRSQGVGDHLDQTSKIDATRRLSFYLQLTMDDRVGLFLICSFFIIFFHITFSIFLMTYIFPVLMLWSYVIRDFLCHHLICPRSGTEKSCFSC